MSTVRIKTNSSIGFIHIKAVNHGYEFELSEVINDSGYDILDDLTVEQLGEIEIICEENHNELSHKCCGHNSSNYSEDFDNVRSANIESDFEVLRGIDGEC